MKLLELVPRRDGPPSQKVGAAGTRNLESSTLPTAASIGRGRPPQVSDASHTACLNGKRCHPRDRGRTECLRLFGTHRKTELLLVDWPPYNLTGNRLFLHRKGTSKMTVSEAARQVYELELKDRLESNHRDQFVAIEPKSKAYFLGETFIAAAMAAKDAFPERTSFVLRIGHDAAFHIGARS